jgi:hypothetical protein
MKLSAHAKARLSILALLLLAALAPIDGSQAQGANLLANPGFEGRFEAWSGINEIQVAPGWTPWWFEDPGRDLPYFRPEYKRADAGAFPYRVFEGGSAQQWFTFHASHLAGMYQQVFNVTPGQRYRFTIWAQVWSSSEDDPFNSVNPANPRLRIGIDPSGNWQAGASTVTWSAEAPMSGIIDRWHQMSLEATAENTVITVFMRTNPDFANKHNDTYWDNASLVAVEAPAPTAPPPTATPDQPTATVAAPTATASPAATATAAPPTARVQPTRETPTATAPAPSATPEPSPTPEATATTVTIALPTTTHSPVPSPTLTLEPVSEAERTPAVAGGAAGEEEGPSPSLLAIGGLALLLVVLVVIAANLVFRRTPPGPPDQE